MANRMGWMECLAVAAILGWGGATAAPGDCLSYRDNPHVAACANQYGPSGPPRRSAVSAPAAPSQSIRVVADAELRSVPVVVAVKAAPATPVALPESPSFTVDRQILTNTVVIGALAGTLLILVALGFWRWGTTLLKDCPWCASKISRSAHTCPRCFRAL
jgi:hypothetical protein